jgi:hypothetical protein
MGGYRKIMVLFMHRLQVSFLLVSVVLLGISASTHAAPVQWETVGGGNGHFYDVILVPGGITWTDADAAARALGLGWHLATITSQEENDFVFSLASSNPAFWNLIGGNGSGPWFGGFKVGPRVGDYAWVTGEPFVFTNWGPREPFGNGERIGLFGFGTLIGPFWNDIGPDRLDVVSYLIETPFLEETLAVSPPALNFGEVTPGDFLDLALTIQNTGTMPLNGTLTPPAAPFSIRNYSAQGVTLMVR